MKKLQWELDSARYDLYDGKVRVGGVMFSSGKWFAHVDEGDRARNLKDQRGFASAKLAVEKAVAQRRRAGR